MLMTPYSAVAVQYSSLSANYEIKFRLMAVPLDDVDIQLLTALQEDADRTNVELARLAGLSPAATLHRVRRLKETGVIRVIRAELDPALAGFPLQVYVTATLARRDPRSSRVFDDLMRSTPQIVAADNVAGEMDYILTVVARDVSELQAVLASLATRGGQRLVTYLRLEQIKPPSRLPLAPVTVTESRRVKKHLPHDGAGHAGDRPAADPHLAVGVLGDVNSSAAAQSGALAGHVRGLDPARGQQPLPEGGVEAARDRILHRADQRAERAHLQRLRRAVRIGPGDADVQVHRTRPDREHRLGAGQQRRHPAGSVVGPGDVDDVGPLDVQRPRRLLRYLVLGRATADQRRRREGQAPLGPPHRDQPGTAFLDDGVRIGRLAAGLPPGMAGAERGVPGERQLPGRREDPDEVIGPGRARRQHERGLRQVRPARERLHLLVGEPLGAEHHRDRVAEVRGCGEDVDLAELVGHTPSLGGTVPTAAGPIPRPAALTLRFGDAKPATGHGPG